MPQNIGTVVQIIGAVLDIKFPPEHLPNLLNAIEIEHEGKKLTVEVAQHIGDDTVRCIAMGSTDGLVRGLPAVDTGASIKVPVGRQTLGRIFNLLGEAVDNKPQPETEEKWEIHRPAPSFEEQEGSTQVLETGIKVVDLIAPYLKGGKIGLFGGVKDAKFRRQVVPGDLLKLEVEIIKVKGPIGVGKALATVNGEKAVSAEITFAIK
jgi:F-type H+-transporting ATPase subunit beta